MEHITVREAAEKWGVSTRRVQVLCAQGRVKGAYRFGKSWMIPATAILPNAYRTLWSRIDNLGKPSLSRVSIRCRPKILS